MPINYFAWKRPSNQSTEQGWKSRRNRKKIKKYVFYGVSLAIFAAILGSAVIIGALAWYSRDLPDPNALMARDVPQSTKIYDRTGETVLFEIHGDEQRTLVPLSDIPEYMQWATISIEDKDFYNHHGIYWRGLVRAFTIGFLKNQRVQGTSTLTQQFVKNAILTNERSIVRKLKEFVLTIQIERIFTKDQILQLYFNEIPYGSTYYGIESASQGYFGKSAKALTLDEAALLAALPQAPGFYSPYGTGSRGDNRELLIGRQRYILDQMADQGYIPQEDADAAKAVDVLAKLAPKRVGDIRAPHFVEYVRSQLVETYGQRTVEQGGLRVITTLDWEKQKIAEEEVRLGVEKRGETYGFTNAALIALDPKTGHVISMVGSKDFFDQENDGQVNVTLRPRQPGSSFKPIVYAAAFLKGYTPDMMLWDVNTEFKTDTGTYAPKNYSLDENGPITARSALQRSLNTPAVKLLYLVGIPRVLDFAESLGYTTFGERDRFGLALVLGGGEVKLIEHARAYAAFALDGEQVPLASILRVENPAGDVLEEWEEPHPKRVFNQEAARQISNILTGTSVQVPGRHVAAKTGTTNGFHDAWTIGYTPSLVAGVWVGNSNNDEMRRGAAGEVVATPIFRGFMSRSLEGTPVESFPAPPPNTAQKPILSGQGFERKIRIDTITGKLATEFTPEDLVEERSFSEAHNELWYIDKDDPAGPAPTRPENDPQFANWEAAVLRWTRSHDWNTTSTPPTEYDDVHTPQNQPNITILAPSANSTWNSRSETIRVQASAARGVTSIEARIGGTLIGTSAGVQTFTVSIPNTIPQGFHEIEITVFDDVKNRASARVVVNLTASPSSFSASIVTPADGDVLKTHGFPYNISLLLARPLDISQISVYLRELPNGSPRLISNEFDPESPSLTFSWNTPPSPGMYEIYPVLHMKDGDIISGSEVAITVR